MQCTLSALLQNIADTLRAHALEGDQVIIAGDELTGLIDTLDYAADTARKLEDGAVALPSAPPARHAAGDVSANVTPFPVGERRHHRRARGARRHSPWRPQSVSRPGLTHADDGENDGGDAA